MSALVSPLGHMDLPSDISDVVSSDPADLIDYSEDPGTPTPSTTPVSHLGGSMSNPRRPPRKSTLTQQQKNQKRQRATQDQLITLEIEFNKNPTPTAIVRDQIAQKINMTERSVQIWFQNRQVHNTLVMVGTPPANTLQTGKDQEHGPKEH